MRCHHPPGDEALIHRSQAATEQSAQQVEELLEMDMELNAQGLEVWLLRNEQTT